MEPPTLAFWSRPAAEVLAGLETTPAGLSAAEAASRLTRYASRRLVPKKRTDAATLLLNQFSSPIVLLLLGATAISLFLRNTTDAVIILAIVLASGLLGFWQEWGAADAVEKLLALVQVKASVLRDGTPVGVPLADRWCRGTSCSSRPATPFPATAASSRRATSSSDEATLTGETFPVEKVVAVLPAGRPSASGRTPLSGHQLCQRHGHGAGRPHGQGHRVRPVSDRLSSGRRRPSSSAASAASATCSWR